VAVTAKEVMAVEKATIAAMVKAEEDVAATVAEKVVVAKAEEAAATTPSEKAVAVKGVPDAMPDLKVVGKGHAATTGSDGSSPSRKRFRGAWRYVVHLLIFSFLSPFLV
jgi:hypothetical protein